MSRPFILKPETASSARHTGAIIRTTRRFIQGSVTQRLYQRFAWAKPVAGKRTTVMPTWLLYRIA